LKFIIKPLGVFFLTPPEKCCPICYWDGVIQIMTSKTFFLKHNRIMGLSAAVFIYQIFFGDYFLNIKLFCRLFFFNFKKTTKLFKLLASLAFLLYA